MYVKHIPDPYSSNRRGGPGVVVHKHSQAKAFSIFRAHDLFNPKQTQKPGKGGRHLDTSQSILLATKNVQEQYTSTKTTGRLKTHGLLEERSTSTPPPPLPSEGSPDGSQQSKSPASIRRSRSQSLVRKDKGGRDKVKVKGFQKEEKRRKEEKGKEKKKERKDGAGSQTSSREGVVLVTRSDGFWSRLPGRHTGTHASLPALSNTPVASGPRSTVTVHSSVLLTITDEGYSEG